MFKTTKIFIYRTFYWNWI